MSKTTAVVVLALVGCSSAGSPSSISGAGDAAVTDGAGAGPDGASHADAAPGADASGNDASSKVDAATPGDAAPPGDGPSGEAAADPLAPQPPPGSTECGHGTITSGDFAKGCTTPSFVLDDVPQLDGGLASTPRSCGALTIGGGSWQAWCTPTAAYVWARFDQLTNTGTLVDCHQVSLLWVDEGVYDTGSGGGNGAHVATYQNGSEIVGTVPGTPQTGIYDVTLDNTATGGSANLFVLGSLEDSCNQGAPGPPTVYGGLSVSWTAQ